jgi:hypothetical protein
MKFLVKECDHCETSYSIEYNEEERIGWEPSICPFCGEDLEDEDDEYDYDEDDDE